MKLALIGIGNQGKKRSKVFEKKINITVDKFNKSADFKSIYDVPLSSYDGAICCLPDNEKEEIIEFLLKNKKNVMVEKPFFCKNINKLNLLEKIRKKNKLTLYVAYNHRFEPSLIKLQKYIKQKKIGKVYYSNFFYGNGTSLDVKNSLWKDKSKGVVFDLGSHLIDLSYFLFNRKFKFRRVSVLKHENKSNDHAYFNSSNTNIKINCEVNLLTWKNNCRFEIVGQKGALMVNSLQKWGGSEFVLYKRIFPSGKPIEEKTLFKGEDPTWKSEAKYFLKLIKNKSEGNLKKEIKIIQNLNKILNDK